MKRPAFKIEKRSLTRLDPEKHLIEAQADAAYLAERCPLRMNLDAALDAFRARYGSAEAAGYCAARARTGLGPIKGPSGRVRSARVEGERKFRQLQVTS